MWQPISGAVRSIAFFLSLLATTVVRADIVEYCFSGTVTEKVDPQEDYSNINPQDALTGFLRYDDGLEGESIFGMFLFSHPQPFLGLSFNVAQHAFFGDVGAIYTVFVVDDFPPVAGFEDSLLFGQDTPLATSVTADEHEVRVEFRGPASALPNADSLPSSLDGADWDEAIVGFYLDSTKIEGIIDLNSLQASRSGDFNCNGTFDAVDIDLLSAEVKNETNGARMDLNYDGSVDEADRSVWVEDENFSYTYFGDADLNGQFNSSDLVVVFVAGEYEDDLANNSGWAAGDWNGDADFDSSDMVVAFQRGGYELGPRAVRAVPEPAGGVLLLLATVAFCRDDRRRSGRPRPSE
jgi:hypothetical protein